MSVPGLSSAPDLAPRHSEADSTSSGRGCAPPLPPCSHHALSQYRTTHRLARCPISEPHPACAISVPRSTHRVPYRVSI
eukprot:267048-Rhodomonas_salina.1